MFYIYMCSIWVNSSIRCEGQGLFFLPMDVQLHQYHLLKRLFTPLNYFCTFCLKSVVHLDLYESISRFSVLCHWSVYLSSTNTTVFPPLSSYCSLFIEHLLCALFFRHCFRGLWAKRRYLSCGHLPFLWDKKDDKRTTII